MVVDLFPDAAIEQIGGTSSFYLLIMSLVHIVDLVLGKCDKFALVGY